MHLKGKLTVSRGTSCVDDAEQVMCIKRSVFNNGAAHLPKVVSWEFFLQLTIELMWINFRHWRQMKRWPRQTNCMQFNQFSQAINNFEKSNSNKQTRVERERGRSILVYQTRIKKQVIILEWDSNGHAETGHRDIFSYTSPNSSFLWFIFLSQNNLSSGNLRANWPFVTKTSFYADIRLKYPRNFQINLILCLQFSVVFFNRAMKWKLLLSIRNMDWNNNNKTHIKFKVCITNIWKA